MLIMFRSSAHSTCANPSVNYYCYLFIIDSFIFISLFVGYNKYNVTLGPPCDL